MSDSNQAFWYHHRDGYSVIAFPPELATAHMAEVRDAGVKVIEHVSAVKTPACLVDLSALDYMGSSLVASIVRIWKVVKEKHGRMVVVTSNDRIHEVLKAAGLTRIWTVVNTFESGVHALGFSPEAQVEKRERRLLAFVAPVALVGGLAAVAVHMIPRLSMIRQPADWLVYTVIGLSVVASCISTFREQGWRRILSILVFAASVPLLGLFIWHAEIRLPQPPALAAPPAPPPVPRTSNGLTAANIDEADPLSSAATDDSGESPGETSLVTDDDSAAAAAESPDEASSTAADSASLAGAASANASPTSGRSISAEGAAAATSAESAAESPEVPAAVDSTTDDDAGSPNTGSPNADTNPSSADPRLIRQPAPGLP